MAAGVPATGSVPAGWKWGRGCPHGGAPGPGGLVGASAGWRGSSLNIGRLPPADSRPSGCWSPSCPPAAAQARRPAGGSASRFPCTDASGWGVHRAVLRAWLTWALGHHLPAASRLPAGGRDGRSNESGRNPRAWLRLGAPPTGRGARCPLATGSGTGVKADLPAEGGGSAGRKPPAPWGLGGGPSPVVGFIPGVPPGSLCAPGLWVRLWEPPSPRLSAAQPPSPRLRGIARPDPWVRPQPFAEPLDLPI